MESEKNLTFEVPGIKIYDPRDRKYKTSDNPALIFRHLVKAGCFIMSNEPDDDSICNWADFCDEEIKPTWQDQPTEDGYYWFKSKVFGTEIVNVINFPNDPLVMEIGTSERSSIDCITGKWYGPITPPEGE